MNFWNLVNTPFPRPRKTKKNFLWICLLGFSCSLFIILFKPFGIQNFNDDWYFELIIFSMGLVFIAAVLFIEWLIPTIFPGPFKKWKLGKALIWYTLVIFFIGGIVFLYKSYLGGYLDFTLTEYLLVIGRTLLLALTVSFFGLGIFQFINRKQISRLTSNEAYWVTSKNGKAIRFNLKDVLFVSSDDNYVDIHYHSAGNRKKMIFRSSLKNIESQIVHPLSPIKRCHRGYLINTEFFEIKKMSSRSMTISLKNYKDEIPVSKQYADAIKEILRTHP